MKLQRISKRIRIYPHEKYRDRPALGYIQGDAFSIAVDAGHSANHIQEFYAALKEEHLPLPSVTILTHWHWDHSFAAHAANGLVIANSATGKHLASFREKIKTEGTAYFLSLDETIQREYEDTEPVITLPDLVFENQLYIDAGNCPVHLFRTVSPHTDDATLVHVPNERVLFIGDASSGVFPSWEKDTAVCRKFAETIKPLDFVISIRSHSAPETKEEFMQDLWEDCRKESV